MSIWRQQKTPIVQNTNHPQCRCRTRLVNFSAEEAETQSAQRKQISASTHVAS